MYNPELQIINFNRDSVYFEGMTYVDLINTESEVIIIQTVRKLFQLYTKQKAEKAKLTHKLQGIVDHPSERE